MASHETRYSKMPNFNNHTYHISTLGKLLEATIHFYILKGKSQIFAEFSR